MIYEENGKTFIDLGKNNTISIGTISNDELYINVNRKEDNKE